MVFRAGQGYAVTTGSGSDLSQLAEHNQVATAPRSGRTMRAMLLVVIKSAQ